MRSLAAATRDYTLSGSWGELPESDERRVLVVYVNGRGRVARRAGESHRLHVEVAD